jgi:hypothetical protein
MIPAIRRAGSPTRRCGPEYCAAAGRARHERGNDTATRMSAKGCWRRSAGAVAGRGVGVVDPALRSERQEGRRRSQASRRPPGGSTEPRKLEMPAPTVVTPPLHRHQLLPASRPHRDARGSRTNRRRPNRTRSRPFEWNQGCTPRGPRSCWSRQGAPRRADTHCQAHRPDSTVGEHQSGSLAKSK